MVSVRSREEPSRHIIEVGIKGDDDVSDLEKRDTCKESIRRFLSSRFKSTVRVPDKASGFICVRSIQEHCKSV